VFHASLGTLQLISETHFYRHALTKSLQAITALKLTTELAMIKNTQISSNYTDTKQKELDYNKSKLALVNKHMQHAQVCPSLDRLQHV